MTHETATLERQRISANDEELQMTSGLRLALQLNDAVIADDDAEVDRMMRRIAMPASVLSALKTGMGADWIRSRGLRTDLADAEFGHGWLDR